MNVSKPIVAVMSAAALFACHREEGGKGVEIPPPAPGNHFASPAGPGTRASVRERLDPPVAEEVAAELGKDQAAFARLPEGEQIRFRNLVDGAGQALRKHRPRKALNLLNEARRLRLIDQDLLLFRGAAWMQLREYDTACRYFQLGLRYYPEFTPLELNLAECHFMRGRYAESEELLARTLGDNPEMPLPTLRVLEFRSLLCLLQLGRAEEARRRVEGGAADATPFDRYARAAIRLAAGSDEQAQALLAGARSVGAPQARAPYEECLIASGLISGQLPLPPVEEDTLPEDPGGGE